jgi:aminopeptidase N
LDLDSLLSSHPVEAVVTDPDEINSQFDDISYDKGSSLLRMLSAYMGYDNFLKGITSYLRKYQFGNARTDDLWNSIGEISPHAKAMMNTWTKQAGYPVISVDEVGKLTQHRFYLVQPENASQIPTSEFRYVWKVPFKYITEKSNEPREADTDATSVSWTKDDGWIKLNVLQTSFIRVNYDVQNWIRLTEHLMTSLDTTPLKPEDRAGLIEDAFALSDAGQLDIGIALNLSLYLVKERHYVPWHAAIAWFNRIDTRLRYTPAYGDYKAFVRYIINPALQDILHNLTAMETNLAVYLRSDLYATATQYGNKNVTAMLVQMFNNFYHHNVSVDPNLKQVVYMTGIAEGDEPEWNFLWGIYKTSSDPIEQQLILYALSRTRQLWVLARYLQYSVSDVRSQDTLRVIQYVAQNEHGLSLSWNFLRLHWDYLLKRHGIGSFAMRRLIHTFAKAFTSKFRQNEFQAFFGMSGNVGGSRGVQQGYEYIKSNLYWFEHTYQTTSSWLADKRKLL